jgi:hypothetical protein
MNRPLAPIVAAVVTTFVFLAPLPSVAHHGGVSLAFGPGSLATAAGFIVLVGALAILRPVGVVLGALVDLLQRQGPADRPS